MLPLLLVAVVSLSITSLINARTASLRIQNRIELQLQGVVTVLSNNRFPLTNTVLKQMGELANAKFFLTDQQGTLLAASSNELTEDDLPDVTVPANSTSEIALNKSVQVLGTDYFYATYEMAPTEPNRKIQTLHILFPRNVFNSALRATFVPPLLVGLLTLTAVIVATNITASRFSRVLKMLSDKLHLLAKGGFSQAIVPSLDDEAKDLAVSLNQTAVRLEQYENEIRTTERMHAISSLSAGLAHDIRNAATGCKMALELHAEQLMSLKGQSNKEVATGLDRGCLETIKQQLSLIESRIQELMQLGGEIQTPNLEVVNLASLVEQTVQLATPSAKHKRIDFQWSSTKKILIKADKDQLNRAITNLILNAFDAVTKEYASADGLAYVKIELKHMEQYAVLTILDNGKGPNKEIANSMFSPFVSVKPEGVGLGLAVAKHVIESHQGKIDWCRVDDRTEFKVTLPALVEGESDV